MKSSKRKRKSGDQASVEVAPEHVEETPPVAVVEPAKSEIAATQPLTTPNTSIALAASCTMREAAVLKTELLKLLSSEKPVVIDVSAVERVDTSALQLLCAFVRDRRAKRLSTRWHGAPPAFADAVQVLGLTQALNYAPETSSPKRAA